MHACVLCSHMHAGRQVGTCVRGMYMYKFVYIIYVYSNYTSKHVDNAILWSELILSAMNTEFIHMHKYSHTPMTTVPMHRAI